MGYSKTNWVDGTTPLDQTNMNKIENELIQLEEDSGNYITMTLDTTTYVLTLKLYNVNGEQLGETQSVDLPIESLVVSGRYDATNKTIILTLKSGQEITIPVTDLVDGIVHQVNGKTGDVTLYASDITATNTQTIQQNLERIDERIDDLDEDKQDAIDGTTDLVVKTLQANNSVVSLGSVTSYNSLTGTNIEARGTSPVKSMNISTLIDKANAVPTSKSDISTLGGLVLPNGLTMKELVGVDNLGNQIRVQLGTGLSFTGSTSPYTLTATGGGSQLYMHNFVLFYNGGANPIIRFSIITPRQESYSSMYQFQNYINTFYTDYALAPAIYVDDGVEYTTSTIYFATGDGECSISCSNGTNILLFYFAGDEQDFAMEDIGQGGFDDFSDTVTAL